LDGVYSECHVSGTVKDWESEQRLEWMPVNSKYMQCRWRNGAHYGKASKHKMK
jgi:hypothetical protein